MKATGVVRKVDELGRIVLPIELRKVLNINIKDPMEIFVEDEKIILKKYSAFNACVICEQVTEHIKINDKPLCKDCIERIQKEQSLLLQPL